MKKKEAEGECSFDSQSDLLAKALGKPEHPGRVRGIGGSAGQSSCLNIAAPTSKRDQEVQSRVEVILGRELALVAKEKEAWEKERALYQKREEEMKEAMKVELQQTVEAEVAKMYAKLHGLEVPAAMSPKPVTPPTGLNNLASEKGSCSQRIGVVISTGGLDSGTVKKRLELEEIVMEEANQVDADKEKDGQKLQNDEVVEDFEADRPSGNDKVN